MRPRHASIISNKQLTCEYQFIYARLHMKYECFKGFRSNV